MRRNRSPFCISVTDGEEVWPLDYDLRQSVRFDSTQWRQDGSGKFHSARPFQIPPLVYPLPEDVVADAVTVQITTPEWGRGSAQDGGLCQVATGPHGELIAAEGGPHLALLSWQRLHRTPEARLRLMRAVSIVAFTCVVVHHETLYREVSSSLLTALPESLPGHEEWNPALRALESRVWPQPLS